MVSWRNRARRQAGTSAQGRRMVPGPVFSGKMTPVGGQPLTVSAPDASEHYLTCITDEPKPEFTRFAVRDVAPDAAAPTP